MNGHSTGNARYMDLLSRLLFHQSAPTSGDGGVVPDLETIFEMSEERFGELIRLADTHHVIVRTLQVIEKMAAERHKIRVQQWCADALAAESARITHAVEWLSAIVNTLQDSGCRVVVIKSLDHWPDLGSDLDLYTSGSAERVVRAMREKLQAELEPRSWGDKLAHKWNFQLPGLQELVEVHVRYLGQTGEQKLMAERVIERSTRRRLNGHEFSVPAPEERVLISTLQRMYRHFYFRLCDMADFAALLSAGALDFLELQRGAEIGGIWPGVASFLVIVANYVNRFGSQLRLPDNVVAAAYAPDLQVQFRGNFLRVPMRPAAGLYGSQLLNAGKHGDLRAISRLPLLPPLAVSALLAYRLTGSDKGVW
jgi:hypothetical protein